MTRQERIIEKIDRKKGVGLELGPLTTPILTKDQANISYADHMSLAELKKKYAHEPVELEKIISPDFIINKPTLKQSVGNKKFDYVLASHVIEHIPDMVSWLKDIHSVLKPGGVLSLAIPDKRYTFDITRQASRPADIIGAYLDDYSRSSSSAMFDFASECRTGILASEVLAMPVRDFSKKPRRYTDTEVWDMCKTNASGKEYVDCHCYVFTPYSFMEILRSLIRYDLFDFEVINFYDTPVNEIEFFVALKRAPSGSSKNKRLASIPKVNRPQTDSELRARIQELELELQDVYRSKSWTVTKPLREVLSKTVYRGRKT